MTNKGKGIAALIGVGVSALAFFGYKRLPKDKKDQIKSSLNDAGKKIKDTAHNVEDSVTDTYNQVKGKVNSKANGVKKDMEEITKS